MSTSRSIFGTVWRLVFFVALIGVLLAGILLAIQRPVGGASRAIDVVFTDANGLKTGDDVRMFGVAVGKVERISLDGTMARVRIGVRDDRPLYDSTRYSIRYQNLAGQRYVDIQQPAQPGRPIATGVTVGADHSTGSIDITALFNGMEPVLKEFSPEAVNELAVNALAVFEGDGSRIGATLNAIGTLSSYVSDRQAVISLLLHNFQQVSDQIGGHSTEAQTLLRGISDVFVNLQQQFDGLMDAVDIAPPVLGAFNDLLATLGFTHPGNPDLNADLRQLFPDPKAALDALGKLPAVVQGLTALIPAPGQSVDLTCTHGHAQVPVLADVLIHGQRISVCKNG
ncbi:MULTISPECIES: MlaD family protein [unclassified Nocardia]|uniref:MlaD family protein n=1 Tax=unclassified Nocardia TaxID=2637762 RepID=UPI0030E374A5